MRPDRAATRQALRDVGVSEDVVQKVLREVDDPRRRVVRSSVSLLRILLWLAWAAGGVALIVLLARNHSLRLLGIVS